MMQTLCQQIDIRDYLSRNDKQVHDHCLVVNQWVRWRNSIKYQMLFFNECFKKNNRL